MYRKESLKKKRKELTNKIIQGLYMVVEMSSLLASYHCWNV